MPHLLSFPAEEKESQQVAVLGNKQWLVHEIKCLLPFAQPNTINEGLCFWIYKLEGLDFHLMPMSAQSEVTSPNQGCFWIVLERAVVANRQEMPWNELRSLHYSRLSGKIFSVNINGEIQSSVDFCPYQLVERLLVEAKTELQSQSTSQSATILAGAHLIQINGCVKKASR